MHEVHLKVEYFQDPMENKAKTQKRVWFSDSITTTCENNSDNSTKKTEEKRNEKPNTQQLRSPKMNVKEKKTRKELHKLRPEQYLPQRIIEVTVHFYLHPL